MEYLVFFWKFGLLSDLCYATIKMHLYNSYAHAHHVHLSKAKKRLHEMYLSFSFLLRIRKKNETFAQRLFYAQQSYRFILNHTESWYKVIPELKKVLRRSGSKSLLSFRSWVFYANGIYSTNCRVLQTQCFWTMGNHNTMLQSLKQKYW